MNIKNVFLNGELFEIVYMEPPPGVSAPSGHVCRLRHAIYDFKQAPFAWFEKFRLSLLSTIIQRILLIMSCFTVHHHDALFCFFSMLMI